MECKEMMVHSGTCGNYECCCEEVDACQTKKCVRFPNNEEQVAGPCKRAPPESSGVCACCQACNREPCQHSGRPVLVYELPTPKFDDLTTNKRDYGKKPLPQKEVPAWHPMQKERWKSLDVPSMNKTTYQTDYTPPKDSTNICPQITDIPKFPPKKKEEEPCRESPKCFKVCKQMTKGPCHVHNVCDKTQIREGEIHYSGVEQVPGSGDLCHKLRSPATPQKRHQEMHGPECEKHCFSSPRCHDESPAVRNEPGFLDCYRQNSSSPYHEKSSGSGLQSHPRMVGGHHHDVQIRSDHEGRRMTSEDTSPKSCLKQNPSCSDGYCMDPACGSRSRGFCSECRAGNERNCLSQPVKCQAGTFTLCCSGGHSGPQRWWKKGCETDRKSRALPDDCGCRGKTDTTETVKFERGGLIP